MNAIILAAGMGTRLRPLTNDIPKCLVPVNGEPMVERQIRFLKEAGIDDITLVSGYRREKLDYLKEKYGVSIVFNTQYEVCNNIWSLYSVMDRFSDSYVVEGDVYMTENCFTDQLEHSTYFSVWHEEPVNEWGLEVAGGNRLETINIGHVRGFVMSGISYWTAADCSRIVERIQEIVATRDYTNLFWDQAILELYPEMDIQVRRFDELHEIDTELELRALEYSLSEQKTQKSHVL